MAMSLDGLRAWIGVVERKLTMRTRVFLVLVAIAIGAAAVGIVLAVDAQDSAVSKDDLQAVRDELAGSAPAETPQVTKLEAELESLRSEVASLQGETSSPETAPEKAEEPRGGDGGGDGGAPAPEERKQREEAFKQLEEKDSK